ncbi:AsmA-like C-terminal domain-containing protein [Breoghania sp.]|uniref:YhdP family protein n=1 Tax=Breoghania sp. TaxID=2065378 RepID=UPI00262DBF3E|nr:AsmA-like C-terminal domain-containing protein [Breoghania sp.]MDJ0929572.1 AsmA-like C-terminal domain-containing protein [Breoghania sp.]
MLLGLVVLAFLIVVGARLAFTPYDSVWLGRLASDYLAQRARGADLDIEAVRIDFSGTAAAPLSLLDVSVQTPGGAVSAEIPEVRMNTSFLRLLIGDVNLGRIRLERPEISVERAEGAVSVIPSAADLAKEVDAAVGAAVADFATFGIESVVVDDAEVALNGQLKRTFHTIDMWISRDETGKLMQIDASVAGRAGRWNMRFRNGVDEKTGGRWFSLSAADVTVADLLPADYPVRPGRGLDLPLFPQTMFHLDDDDNLVRGEVRLGVGAGYISLHDDDAILIDEMILALSWTPDHPQVVLEPSFAAFGNTRVIFHGEIRPPDATRHTWQFALESPQARLKPRDVSGPPLRLDRGLLFGSFDPAQMLLDIDTFSLRAGPISVTAAGNVEFGPDGPLAAVAVSSQELTVASLKRLWPAMMVPEARSWFIKHAVSGKLEDARFIVALDPLGFDGDQATVGWTPDGLRLDFKLKDGKLKTIGDLPDLTGMSATATICDGAFKMAVDKAQTVAPGGGQVGVDDGSFTIPDLRPEEKEGQLKLTLHGAAEDIARIAEQHPVDGRSRLDISPDSLSGKADVTVTAGFPVRRNEEPVTPQDVAWTVAAKLKDFSSTEAIGGQVIRNADLQVSADPAAAVVRGRGLLNGLPVEIDLDQPLKGGSPRDQGVVLDFDAGDLADRGIDLGGLIDGKLRLNVQTAKNGVRWMVADLTQSELRLPELGWTKGAGVPARASVTVREKGKTQEIDDFRLTSDGVDIQGNLRIGANGELLEADFDKFALRKSDSGRLSITRKGSGYSVQLHADSFDARGFIAKLKRGDKDAAGESKSAGNNPMKNVDVEVRANRLTGFNSATITSFALDLRQVKGEVAAFSAKGLVDGHSEMTASLTSDGDVVPTVEIDAGGAGGLFRFFNFYDRLRGGKARMTVNLPGEGHATGRLLVTDLTITDDPALKKIVNADPDLIGGDSHPISRRRRLARGEMSFQKLDVLFHKVGRVLTIDSGALRGPILGGAVDGNVHLDTQQVNLKGTFVPAYAVNNLFGQIPVLGQLLGGRNGGLLGVTFRVTGDLQTPTISVNPMSAIAPGIFRKIFE